MAEYPVLDGNGASIISTEQSGVVPQAGVGSQGWWDYNHGGSATVLTLADTFYTLDNDALGPQTNRVFAPAHVADVYDGVTGEFDFSDLTVGDELTFRISSSLITSSPNREFKIRMRFAIGSASEFPLTIEDQVLKTADTHPDMRTFKFYIGSADVRDYPAMVEASSDGTGDTILSSGYYLTLR